MIRKMQYKSLNGYVKMENIMQINLWANGMQFCAWSTRFPSLCSHFVQFIMNKMYSKEWHQNSPSVNSIFPWNYFHENFRENDFTTFGIFFLFKVHLPSFNFVPDIYFDVKFMLWIMKCFWHLQLWWR